MKLIHQNFIMTVLLLGAGMCSKNHLVMASEASSSSSSSSSGQHTTTASKKKLRGTASQKQSQEHARQIKVAQQNQNTTLPSNENEESAETERELLWHWNGFHAQKYSTSPSGFTVDWAVFPPPNRGNMPFYVEFISSQYAVTDTRTSPIAYAQQVYPSTWTSGVSSLISASQTGTGTFHMRLVNRLGKGKKTIFSFTQTDAEAIHVSLCANYGSQCDRSCGNFVTCLKCSSCGCGWHGPDGQRVCNSYSYV